MTANKKDRIIVDADKVVYMFDEPVCDQLNLDLGTNYKPEDLAVWGKTGDERDYKYKLFENPEFIGSLPMYPGAQKFIKELQKRGEVIFCTACFSQTLTARSEALQRDFGVSPENVITASKKDLIHAEFMIDDSPFNIRHSNCTYPILLRRPGSEAVSGCMSATKYEDIITFIDFIQRRRNVSRIPQNAILCLVGPTGAGKTEMVKAAVNNGYKTIRAFSTAGSKKYDPMSREDFENKIKAGDFAEYTVYGGEYYGILVDDLEAIEPTDKVICAVDICGAMALKNIYGTRVALVFCDVSRMNCIKTILSRNLSQDEKAIRLVNMESELSNERFCDFTVRGADDFIKSL